MSTPRQWLVDGAAGRLAVSTQGDEAAPAVVFSHSILSDSGMWERQAALVARQSFRAVCVDTRGHGASPAPAGPYAMADLVADTVAVMDALGLRQAHYVGLSLGGMSGFGLGLAHADRLLSLLLCDARADAPPAVAAPWDERIALARAAGSCEVLADSTCERWFSPAFRDGNPAVMQRIARRVRHTSVEGFEGCARAIQGLDYLADVGRIRVPTTLLVGGNDGPLPGVMRELHGRMPGSRFELVAHAGHLPNIDQPEAFDAALLRHLEAFTVEQA